MSNAALSWAWKARGLKAGPKFVLVALAEHAGDHAGEDWSCFPSVERLMEFTSQSRDTVLRALKTLEDDGWITRRRSRDQRGYLGPFDRFVLVRARAAGRFVEAADDLADEGETADPKTANCGLGEGEPRRQIAVAKTANCGGLDGKLPSHREPSIEPLREPSERGQARDALGEGAQTRGGPSWARELWAMWPSEARLHSSERQVERAMIAELDAAADPAAVMVGARWYVRNPKAWGASGKPMSPHRFLSDARWKTCADEALRGVGGGVDSAQRAFAEPAVRAAFLRSERPESVASYLDPAGWDAERRTIHPRTSMAAGWLRDHWPGDAMDDLGVRLGDVRKGEVQ